MKYTIATLGCKVNQYETQAMEERLRRDGHRPAGPGETADAVIVNTCAVTAESGRKSRQTIRRLRDENPGAVVAVCGCYAQLSPEENEEIGAKVIFGARWKTERDAGRSIGPLPENRWNRCRPARSPDGRAQC